MTALESLKQKIVSQEKIKEILSKNNKQKVVFTNGCFDIIHRGHIDYLSKASDLGDILIVGLNSDSSVKNLKGKTRPIQDQVSRAQILAALEFINFIVIFEEATPLNLISNILPDFLIKGGDYNIKDIVGADIVTKNKGKVITIPFLKGFSTSKIINSI